MLGVCRCEAAQDGDVHGHYDWHAAPSLLARLLLHRTFDQTPEASLTPGIAKDLMPGAESEGRLLSLSVQLSRGSAPWTVGKGLKNRLLPESGIVNSTTR